MGQRNRRSLSLFELLIVMALLAVALAATSPFILKAFRGERFESSVDQLITKLTLAQEIMLDFRTDVTLTLEHEGKELKCTLSVSAPLPNYLIKSVNRYKTISGIETLSFNNEARSQIELEFDGSLGCTPKGVLTLSAQGKEASIFLQGSPAHIQRGEHGQIDEAKVPYPQEILSAA